MRFVDLSITVKDDLASDPKEIIPQIMYMDHEQSVPDILRFFGTTQLKDLPDGLAWVIKRTKLTTHTRAHLDAPYHHHPTTDKGKPAWAIDEVPLGWCYGDGAVLDFSDRPVGAKLTVEGFEKALSRIDYELKERDIVSIRTGVDQYWGIPKYLISGYGMGGEATLWLLEQGIHIVGIDAWSQDRPLPYIVKEFNETGDLLIIWEGHLVGIEERYCRVEELINLDKLPVVGFKLSCYPVRVKKASVDRVGAVAVTEEEKKG